MNVTELNLAGVNTEDPNLTDDLLEIVVSSNRPARMGGIDLWTATSSAAPSPSRSSNHL